jgi:hypothetical protein
MRIKDREEVAALVEIFPSASVETRKACLRSPKTAVISHISPNRVRIRPTKTLLALGAPNFVMAFFSRQTGVDTETGVRDEECFSDPPRGVSIHNTRPERSIFIEEGNSDGWISTDVTVGLEQ